MDKKSVFQTIALYAIVTILTFVYIKPQNMSLMPRKTEHSFYELAGTAGSFVTKAVSETGNKHNVSYYTDAEYIETSANIPDTRHSIVSFYDRHDRKIFEITDYGSDDMYFINGVVYKRKGRLSQD